MTEYVGLGLAGLYNIFVMVIGIQPRNDMEALILFTVACVMAPIIFAALILAIVEARKLIDRLEK